MHGFIIQDSHSTYVTQSDKQKETYSLSIFLTCRAHSFGLCQYILHSITQQHIVQYIAIKEISASWSYGSTKLHKSFFCQTESHNALHNDCRHSLTIGLQNVEAVLWAISFGLHKNTATQWTCAVALEQSNECCCWSWWFLSSVGTQPMFYGITDWDNSSPLYFHRYL